MAMLPKWCSTIFQFCPEALYTTRIPKHTMRARTPVSGPSSPSARSVRPPAVRVRRVRDWENSSKIIGVFRAASALMQTAERTDQQRPQQGADDGRQPTAEGRHRIAGGAVHPEQYELIPGQQGEYGQALRQNRKH